MFVGLKTKILKTFRNVFQRKTFVSVVGLFPVLKVLKKYVAGNIGLSLIRLKNPGSEFKLLVLIFQKFEDIIR